MIKKRGVWISCLSAFACLLLLPSCAKRNLTPTKEATTVNVQDNQAAIFDTIVQQEAMLVTIPVPLYDERILPSSLDLCEKETVALGYQSPFSLQQAIDFFMSQMERYGWNHVVSFDGYKEEHLLFFENPDSYCCVTLKEIDAHHCTIFIYTKRASL